MTLHISAVTFNHHSPIIMKGKGFATVTSPSLCRWGRRGEGAQEDRNVSNSFHYLIILTAHFHKNIRDIKTVYYRAQVPARLRNKPEAFILIFLNRSIRSAHTTSQQTIYAGYSPPWTRAFFAQGPRKFK